MTIEGGNPPRVPCVESGSHVTGSKVHLLVQDRPGLAGRLAEAHGVLALIHRPHVSGEWFGLNGGHGAMLVVWPAGFTARCDSLPRLIDPEGVEIGSVGDSVTLVGGLLPEDVAEQRYGYSPVYSTWRVARESDPSAHP